MILNKKITVELFVFIIYFTWQITNIPVPIWDGSDYIIAALTIVDYFNGNDFLSSLKFLFKERGWRPLNLTALSFPVFYFFNKQINLSLAIIIGLQGLFFYKAIFQFIKAMGLGERVFIPIIVLSIPWIFNRSHDYFADAILLISALYFISSIINYSQKNSFVDIFLLIISGFLFFTSRPAEAIIYTSIVLFYYLIFKSQFRKEILLFSFFCFCMLVALLYYPFISLIGYKSYIIIPSLCYFISFLILIKLFKYEKSVFLYFYIIIILVFIWFYSKKFELFDWVYTTSFGDLAKTTDRRSSNISIFAIFKNIFSIYNLNYFIILFIGSLFYIWYKKSKDVLIICLLSIVIMLIAYSVTGTGDYRRIMLPVFIFYIYSISILSLKSILFKYTIYSFGFLLIIQSIYASIFNNLVINGINFVPISQHSTPSKKVDPNLEMAKVLKPLLKDSGAVSFYSYCYFDGISECTNRGIIWAENQATNARLLEINGTNKIHSKNDLDYNLPLAPQLLNGGYRYILIDSFNDPIKIDKNIQNMLATNVFIDLFIESKNNVPNFHLETIYTLWNRKFYLYRISG